MITSDDLCHYSYSYSYSYTIGQDLDEHCRQVTRFYVINCKRI